jgi:ferredoxin
VAVKARKGVMEFLLVNHPLDCPVCDEGGECQLQDLAFAFGSDFSRMDEAKRTFDSEDLGPIVKKEANRCIVCMRCVRYCDEVMGDDALTAHQRGVWTEISSFDRQPLDCEQCGNCIEVCPVGALTALPTASRRVPGICASTSPSARTARTAARCASACVATRCCAPWHRVPRREPGIPVRARPLRLPVHQQPRTPHRAAGAHR